MQSDIKIQKSFRFFALLAARALTAALLTAQFAFSASAADRLGRESGEPLPRYAALKDATVHLRVGPGKAYAIKWVLRRRHMPVRVIAEYGPWRRVELIDGDRGWVHLRLLTDRRYAVAKAQRLELYAEPEDTARQVAAVAPLTPVRLLSCDAAWCRGEVSGKRGWAPKRNLWGVEFADKFD